MSTSRETVMSALVALIASAYPWVTGPSRRLKLWTDVPQDARPACFVFQGGMEHHVYSAQLINPKRTLDIRLFIYANAKDPNAIGSAQLDVILDALDAAFAAARDPQSGLISLSGGVFSCRIEGDVLIDPGDLDGDALLIVPVKIVLP